MKLLYRIYKIMRLPALFLTIGCFIGCATSKQDAKADAINMPVAIEGYGGYEHYQQKSIVSDTPRVALKALSQGQAAIMDKVDDVQQSVDFRNRVDKNLSVIISSLDLANKSLRGEREGRARDRQEALVKDAHKDSIIAEQSKKLDLLLSRSAKAETALANMKFLHYGIDYPALLLKITYTVGGALVGLVLFAAALYGLAYLIRLGLYHYHRNRMSKAVNE